MPRTQSARRPYAAPPTALSFRNLQVLVWLGHCRDVHAAWPPGDQSCPHCQDAQAAMGGGQVQPRQMVDMLEATIAHGILQPDQARRREEQILQLTSRDGRWKETP
jgi:hypothetical protein